MMSDDLNLLGSLKAPMFLELDTYAEDALRELNNTTNWFASRMVRTPLF